MKLLWAGPQEGNLAPVEAKLFFLTSLFIERFDRCPSTVSGVFDPTPGWRVADPSAGFARGWGESGLRIGILVSV